MPTLNRIKELKEENIQKMLKDDFSLVIYQLGKTIIESKNDQYECAPNCIDCPIRPYYENLAKNEGDSGCICDIAREFYEKSEIISFNILNQSFSMPK